jgi:hypothetical protein
LRRIGHETELERDDVKEGKMLVKEREEEYEEKPRIRMPEESGVRGYREES